MRETRQGGLVLAVQVLVSTLALALLMGACGPSATATPTPTATRAAPAATPTATPTSSAAPRPTDTPARTPTPTGASGTTPVVATPTPTATRVAPTTPAGQQAKAGGIARFSHRIDPPRGWDVTSSYDVLFPAQPVWGMGNLVRACRQDAYKVCPGLAKSWETNGDFTQWTFQLQSNVTWHDGTPFDAQAAVDALNLVVAGYNGRSPARDSWKLGVAITNIEAVGTDKVRVTLKEGRPRFLEVLSLSENEFAYPPHLMKPEVDKGNKQVSPLEVGVVGLGPYKLKEYTKGSLVSVRRYEKYWEKDDAGRQLPYLEGLDYAIIPETETAVGALRTGRLDGMGWGVSPTPEQVTGLKVQFGDGISFIVTETPGNGFAFNTLASGPWNDLRVRKAVSLAYNRQAFNDAFTPGYGGPRTLYMSDSPFVDPDFRHWPGYDQSNRAANLAEAKRLLTEAGYAGGFKTTILSRPVARWDIFAEFVAQQLRPLSIEAKIELVDSATLTDRGCRGEFDTKIAAGPNIMQAVPWAAASEFASIAVNPCGGVRHDNQDVDKMFARMAVTADPAEQIKLARDVDTLILRDQVYYIYNNDILLYPARSYVKNLIKPDPSRVNFMDMARVWLDK